MNRNLYLGLAIIFATIYSTYKFTSHYYQAQIANIHLAHKTAELATEKASADRLRAAASLSDVLSNSLANKEYEINALTLEKTREIHHYATGNVCFNAGLTKLLNAESVNLPSTSSESAAKSESAAAIDAQIYTLTDTDLAEWIANAKGKYETCRSRLDALIDFELKKNKD